MNLTTELSLVTKLIENFDTITTLDFLKRLNLKKQTNYVDFYNYDNFEIVIIKINKNDYWQTHTNLQLNDNNKSNRHYKKCFKNN